MPETDRTIAEDTAEVHPLVAEAARLNLPDLPADATEEQIEQRARLIAEREREFADLSQNIVDHKVTIEQMKDQNDGVWTPELLAALQPESNRYDVIDNFQGFLKQVWTILMPIIAHNGHAIAADLQREIDTAEMYLPKEGSPIRRDRGLADQDVHAQFAHNAANVQSTDASPAQTMDLTRSV